jgi:cell division protease FtsH
VEKDTKTTFADVAGVEEAKAELQEVVGFLKEPGQYTRLGGRAPKGILLIGPPGTGKTLLARAVAGEAHVPFFSINGSEFVEMFVGLGAARVRDLFEQATRSAPCLVFIDELDAIGRFRGGAIPGIPGNDEKEQTLNQLLAEMDGFDSRKGVIILAATNRPEVLDPAILRAGRFDRQVLVSIPDKEGRRQILQVHVKGVPLDETVQLENIAALTPGFSGADLANLVNESALHAARRKAKAVSEKDFIEAIERIVAGIEQRRKVINPEEKRRIAFHELGHATVALSRKTDVKVQKVSIIARGLGALGYTLQRPSEDRYLMDEDELMNKIAVLLGGRASEKVFFAKLSTGAADDLVKATDLARAMVTQFGLSKKIGVATYEKPSVRFLAGPAQGIETREPSEKMREMIDSEINAFLERGLQLAEESVESNRLFIEKGAQVLLEVETLDEAQVGDLWRRFGKPLGETKHLAVG